MTRLRLLPGRLGLGNLRGCGIDIDRGTVHHMVRSCAERTNIHGLRHGLTNVYHGITFGVIGNGDENTRMARGGLRGCLKPIVCLSSSVDLGSDINITGNLT